MTDPIAHIRRELILAAVQRATVALTSFHDDLECVAIGRVVKVTSRHVVVSTSKSNETPIPIEAVTAVKRLDESRKAEIDDSPAPEAA